MNHSAAGNSPSSCSAGKAMRSSAARPDVGGVLQAPQIGGNLNAGSHSYASSFSGNLDSGKYDFPNVQPAYHKRAAGSGAAQNPVSNYRRPLQSLYQQPPQMYANTGLMAKNEAPARIIPIAALNIYQGRWTIKARVTSKGELRHYNNHRGDGKVFSFDLLDSDGGEIRVTCFNSVADQFYDQIEPGRVYMISRGTLKHSQKAFNHLHNDHEIMLDSTSTVQPCFDDDKSIPRQQFHFRSIIDIEGLDSNSIVDVIAIVSSISPTSSIMRKNGTETQKRTLQLKDMSGRTVELTLWGNFCDAEGQKLQTMSDAGVFPVLAVKSCRVNDFCGKSVGTISTSQLFIEPEIPQALKLKAWFNSEGKSMPAVSISRDRNAILPDVRKTISQIKDEKLGTAEKPDWITVSATLAFVKVDNFCYPACPITIGDRQCSKKVTETGDGRWKCERCDQSVDECDYRYILQMQIQDHTGSTWVTAFQESGEDIMGISAKDLYYLRYEHQDDEKFPELLHGVLFSKFLFKLKVKEESFSDEQRVKSTVVKAEKVNFSTETRYLLDLIANFKRQGSVSVQPKTESVVTKSAASGMIHSGINNSYNVARQCGGSAGRASPYGYCNSNNAYGGSRFISSGSTGVHMSCSSCGGTGHNIRDCPSVVSSTGLNYGYNKMSLGSRAGSVSGECYKCHESGHWARDCPGPSSNGRAAYGVSNVGPARYGMAAKQQFGGF
ncbi:Replication protein A 70 kDa DNA-binding subunit C [Striga hermonthica]|uniref:Replication protein A subunit n=1 Tax=Striga hermonthica TaxID=68872 RepID=A0A9N7MW67_STRHE|nr:Replication protein A 70 kDa DNA-binding subunit C [Striga hermonthica]